MTVSAEGWGEGSPSGEWAQRACCTGKSCPPNNVGATRRLLSIEYPGPAHRLEPRRAFGIPVYAMRLCADGNGVQRA
ncbi:Septin-7 [Manis pentadactyla]|nr:Septin-7 [Manis pentadactyla]